MAALSPLLAQLRESRDFQLIMEELERQRPIIPGYIPQKTSDESFNLIEQVKYRSAMRDGFDMLYSLLTGKPI